MTREEIALAVLAERNRHECLFGPVQEEGKGSHEFLSLLVEEVGECARALNDGETRSRLEEELVQVMAVAMAWLESLDHRGAEETLWSKPKPGGRA